MVGITGYLESSETTYSLFNVSFINPNNGITVGEFGTILSTTDGGVSWIQETSGTGNFLRGISFIDVNTGIAVGYEGTILKTTDGGTSWTSQISGTLNNLYGVCFTDVNFGIAVGRNIILRTINGGITWEGQPSSSLYSISLVDENYGTAVGDGIIRTTDGGITWTPQPHNLIAPTFWGVSFTDANNGTIVGFEGNSGGSRILKTTNGGTTWYGQTSLIYNTLFNVCFTDINNGTIVGALGAIFHTTNGGVTFIEEEKTNEVPTEFLLAQNYPNPFNPSTKLSYRISQSGLVTLKVYDVLGTEIETLVNEEKPVGTYELNWNASNLPSGVYFYRLQAGYFVETKKMIVLK